MRCRETVTKGTRARGPRLPTADPGSSLKGPILEGHAGHPSMQYQNGLVGYACMPPRIGALAAAWNSWWASQMVRKGKPLPKRAMLPPPHRRATPVAARGKDCLSKHHATRHDPSSPTKSISPLPCCPALVYGTAVCLCFSLFYNYVSPISLWAPWRHKLYFLLDTWPK